MIMYTLIPAVCEDHPIFGGETTLPWDSRPRLSLKDVKHYLLDQHKRATSALRDIFDCTIVSRKISSVNLTNFEHLTHSQLGTKYSGEDGKAVI